MAQAIIVNFAKPLHHDLFRQHNFYLVKYNQGYKIILQWINCLGNFVPNKTPNQIYAIIRQSYI